jgi:hypothetical protein
VDDAGRALDVTVRTQASSASATRPARLLWRAQIDGSHHWWFENRGPKCALLVYIDDATGKLLHLRFYPDGRLEITHEAATLPYRTFDTLRSVHRSEVVENKRLDDMLALVAEMQAGRELRRSGPSPDGSYVRDSRRQPRQWLQEARHEAGRRTDFTNDPVVIARRQQSLARLKAAE